MNGDIEIRYSRTRAFSCLIIPWVLLSPLYGILYFDRGLTYAMYKAPIVFFAPLVAIIPWFKIFYPQCMDILRRRPACVRISDDAVTLRDGTKIRYTDIKRVDSFPPRRKIMMPGLEIRMRDNSRIWIPTLLLEMKHDRFFDLIGSTIKSKPENILLLDGLVVH
jgi:hypothetical protein